MNFNPLSANFTNWSKHNQTQFAEELFEWFDHFVGLALKGLKFFLDQP